MFLREREGNLYCQNNVVANSIRVDGAFIKKSLVLLRSAIRLAQLSYALFRPELPLFAHDLMKSLTAQVDIGFYTPEELSGQNVTQLLGLVVFAAQSPITTFLRSLPFPHFEDIGGLNFAGTLVVSNNSDSSFTSMEMCLVVHR